MERPSAIPWPPLLYMSAIAAAFYLGITHALPWLPKSISDGLFAVGVLMVVGGLAFDLYAIRTLFAHKTTVMPTKGAVKLVTSGPYSISRNPIYVGNTILTFGLGIATANPWFFITAIVAAVATNFLQIVPEEKHLQHMFGKQWHVYTRKVRRWI